ncbi:MAG TPA: alpha/beta hydrolase [Gemmatimonadaceae bacterium]|nr:alpha/beta hydrolase [Gemmatimonadaceae bacterium]
MPRVPTSKRAVPLAPEAMYPARHPEARAHWVTLPDGERVRIVEVGAADGPPVLLLHGWGCSAFTWRHIAPRLAQDGWRAIAIDLRGHGLSDRPGTVDKYSRDQMVEHLAATMDALEVQRAPIIAHSMGGAVAMALALRSSERVTRLALFGAVGFGIVDRASWSQLLPPSLTGALLPSRIPRWAVKFALSHSRGEKGQTDDDEVDEYWAPTQFPEFLNAMRLLLHGFTWTPWTPTDLAEVRQPLLLMFGDRDPVVRPQPVVPTLARCLPNATLHVAQGAGHVVPEERPEWALGLLLPFLGDPLARD